MSENKHDGKKNGGKKKLWRHFLLGNSHHFQPLKATSKPIEPFPPIPKKVLLERRRGELYEGTRRATSQIFWVPGNKKTRVLLHMEHRNSRFSSPQKLGKKSCCWFLGVLLEMRVLSYGVASSLCILDLDISTTPLTYTYIMCIYTYRFDHRGGFSYSSPRGLIWACRFEFWLIWLFRTKAASTSWNMCYHESV